LFFKNWIFSDRPSPNPVVVVKLLVAFMEEKSSYDPLAVERDKKFKSWLQNKALKDKAFGVS